MQSRVSTKRKPPVKEGKETLFYCPLISWPFLLLCEGFVVSFLKLRRGLSLMKNASNRTRTEDAISACRGWQEQLGAYRSTTRTFVFGCAGDACAYSIYSLVLAGDVGLTCANGCARGGGGR